MLLDITWYSSWGRGSTGASSTPSLARWERVKASQLVRVTSRPYTRTWHREVFSVPGGDHTHLGADVEVSPVPVLAVSSLQQTSRGHNTLLYPHYLVSTWKELFLGTLCLLTRMPWSRPELCSRGSTRHSVSSSR